MSYTRPGDIVIWENWFAVVQHGVTKESLDSNNELTCLHNITVWDEGR